MKIKRYSITLDITERRVFNDGIPFVCSVRTKANRMGSGKSIREALGNIKLTEEDLQPFRHEE